MDCESDLIQRCRRDDRLAQRALYEQTSPMIYRLLVKMLGNEADASDVAQDTYLRAFSHISDFKGQSSISTWLYRIAVNQALQFLRRTKKHLSTEQLDHLRESPEPHSNDPATRLDILQALADLQPSEKTILLLRYQEGLDYHTIAQVLQCAEGTVASRLNRARSRLKEKLGDAYLPREENKSTVHPNKGAGLAL